MLYEAGYTGLTYGIYEELELQKGWIHPSKVERFGEDDIWRKIA